MDIEKKAAQGLQIVMRDDDLDLDITDIVDQYEKYQKNRIVGEIDAFAKAVHNAYLAGIAVGREITEKSVAK